ncbi:MAG: putative colanic acid biosynthesis acetyltransferase [Phycisphaerae bacterium]|nr:putative colanic acid biosynthesis acetyltransferase [Phycisphaerae bacterium]
MDTSGFVNPHSVGNKVGRLAWRIVWMVLFRPTPWFMTGWRSFLLRCFGAKITRAEFHQSVRVWAPWRLKVGSDVYFDRGVNLYNAFGIEVADRVVVSFNTCLCTATHDHRKRLFPLTGRPITIRSDSWIAAHAFIAPGVTVEEGAVVGACAFVVKSVPAWSIVSGNPAAVIGKREIRD